MRTAREWKDNDAKCKRYRVNIDINYYGFSLNIVF